MLSSHTLCSDCGHQKENNATRGGKTHCYFGVEVWTSTHSVSCQKAAYFLVEVLLLLLFSHSVMSDYLWPHGLQHTRLPCPSLSPEAFPNSCILSQWCHPTIFCIPLLLLSSIFPSISAFSNEPALHIRWPILELHLQHQSFQWIFSVDWFNFFAVQGTPKSLF